jgi:hypothetical protein
VKKLLLDGCVPRKFKNHLPGHECVTVPDAGWAGKKNGELLSLAGQAGFEVFITLDRGIEYEQNLSAHNIALIFLRAKSSRLADLIPLASAVIAALEPIGPGQAVHVS